MIPEPCDLRVTPGDDDVHEIEMTGASAESAGLDEDEDDGVGLEINDEGVEIEGMEAASGEVESAGRLMGAGGAFPDDDRARSSPLGLGIEMCVKLAIAPSFATTTLSEVENERLVCRNRERSLSVKM
jgi:hypothetical protein